MASKKCRYFVGDFETTVYKNQRRTDVWASALVEMFTEDVAIFHTLPETLAHLISLKSNIVVYYHNLKFDGQFWADWLLNNGWVQALIEHETADGTTYEWKNIKDMDNKAFRYSITSRGQWYTLTLKYHNYTIELRDSLKLLPFSVKRIGQSFGTKHKKLEMEYEGLRYPGCEITDDEKEYIANDVLVVKEALEIMFNDGHDKLTIGSCCMAEYKALTGKEDFEQFFPDQYEVLAPEHTGCVVVGEYVKRSYRGGWCYLNPEKQNKLVTDGSTFDVNSLYPSMMHSISGNRYPVGHARFWQGNYIPDEAIAPNKFYFVRVKTRFYIKPGYLPFIQIKNSFLYKGTEALTTSDVYDRRTDTYHPFLIDSNGNEVSTAVTLTLTMMDWELVKKHYDLVDCEILDGCYYYSEIGLFDTYIDKYAEIKKKSKGAQREEAKLFLNNLYGKFASNTDSSFKICRIEEGKLKYFIVPQHDKKPGYIPVGSAITSYARCFTISAAQKNYYPGGNGFCYADTDSIHCDLPAEQITGISIDSKEFCCWKAESSWDVAIFTRQKTYIEHIVKQDGVECEPEYDVKCAGMPQRCKDYFLASIGAKPMPDKIPEEHKWFFNKERKLEDFRIGLVVPGKLKPKNIPGGVLLEDGEYTMR